MIQIVAHCLLVLLFWEQVSMCNANELESLPKELQERLASMPEDVKIGIAVLDKNGTPVYQLNSDTEMPVASAIKPAILLELFARQGQVLSSPSEEAARILADPTHLAIAHFSEAARKEIVADLSGVSIMRLGWIMITQQDEVGRKYSNTTYNGATNVAIALLGGPKKTTQAIHARDASFLGMTVNRYMLASRTATGDNTSTPQVLASFHQKLSSRQLGSLAVEILDEIDRILHTSDFPEGTKLFSKGGSLSSDPVTRVQAGWYQEDRATMNFSIMCSQPLHSIERAKSQYRILTDYTKSTYLDLKAAFLVR